MKYVCIVFSLQTHLNKVQITCTNQMIKMELFVSDGHGIVIYVAMALRVLTYIFKLFKYVKN